MKGNYVVAAALSLLGSSLFGGSGCSAWDKYEEAMGRRHRYQQPMGPSIVAEVTTVPVGRGMEFAGDRLLELTDSNGIEWTYAGPVVVMGGILKGVGYILSEGVPSVLRSIPVVGDSSFKIYTGEIVQQTEPERVKTFLEAMGMPVPIKDSVLCEKEHDHEGKDKLEDKVVDAIVTKVEGSKREYERRFGKEQKAKINNYRQRHAR